MSALAKLNQNVQIGLAVAWCVLLLVGGWFLLVSPKRSAAADLAKQADDTQVQIDTNRQLAQQQHPAQPLRVAELFNLTKAMPNSEDMAGVILQLSRAAEASGIRFTSITPSEQTPATGFTKRKISITFVGNFYGLSDFLFRLRNLVAVRGGELEATGRLFTVESVRFDEAPELFPQIQATLDVDVYMYGTPAPVGGTVTPAPAPADTGSTDTTATTTGGDSSTPPPSGATAAGASG